MALDAAVARLHVIEARRIKDISSRGMLHMLASRPVAFLASHVPLRHLFLVDVVIHRMASIAGGTGGPLHIVRRVERLPPVCPLGNEIRPPHAMRHIPLRWLRIVIVSAFREVTLLPHTA